MNKQAIETLAIKGLEVGKALIDYWHEKKLEQDKIKRLRKVIP